MNRFLLSLCVICTAATLASGGCDDDDEGGKTTGDAAVDGPSSPAMCVAAFAAYNRLTLHAMTKPTGACASAADLDVICSKDVGGVARTCGKACFLSSGDKDCTSTCVNQTINPSVSKPCLNCYSDAFNCTRNNCVAPCLDDSSSPGCVACQQQNGCLRTFYSCSGLPAPNPASDAGADASLGN